MKNTLVTRALLAAGLLAAAAAQAQIYNNSAAATSDSPVRAGEATTMTNGAPNLLTTNSPYPDGTPVVTLAPTVVGTPGYPYVVGATTYPHVVTSSPAVVAGSAVYSYPYYSYNGAAAHYPYGTVDTTVMGAAPVYVAPGSTVYPNRPLLGQPAVVQPRVIVPGPTYVLPR
jgi:hypothetical protein